MIVKVKYEETVSREAQVEIDEDEFLAWANDGYGEGTGYPTAFAALSEEPGLLKEWLEDGDADVWQQANDPSCMGYDHTLLEADL